MDREAIIDLLQDYNWMIHEIARQRTLIRGGGNNLTAQYGIEATMPKPEGQNSDPVYKEVERREKKSKYVQKLERKVSFVQERAVIISDEREVAVLECLMDGMSMSAVSRHMGLSRSNIYKIRDSIVDKIYYAEHFGHFGQFKQKKQKMTC
ncbi:DNA-binding response regulator [Salicibibacter kimchii]|uniref:DNA-binding response regulator n=1 Tax=Salicibibacter kimchii TaxID=2099786 RepID=A0A345BUI2_9BACI|nr:DNA-binding response regulator [Salicibibacter kimchii]AXF54613.1 DNA-binding response regulator [Salicibibacter kimchii]